MFPFQLFIMGSKEAETTHLVVCPFVIAQRKVLNFLLQLINCWCKNVHLQIDIAVVFKINITVCLCIHYQGKFIWEKSGTGYKLALWATILLNRRVPWTSNSLNLLHILTMKLYFDPDYQPWPWSKLKNHKMWDQNTITAWPWHMTYDLDLQSPTKLGQVISSHKNQGPTIQTAKW